MGEREEFTIGSDSLWVITQADAASIEVIDEQGELHDGCVLRLRSRRTDSDPDSENEHEIVYLFGLPDLVELTGGLLAIANKTFGADVVRLECQFQQMLGQRDGDAST